MNNLWHRHRLAMKFWMVSNIFLLAWAAGYYLGLWDGGISILGLIAMYAVFTVASLFKRW